MPKMIREEKVLQPTKTAGSRKSSSPLPVPKFAPEKKNGGFGYFVARFGGICKVYLIINNFLVSDFEPR